MGAASEAAVAPSGWSGLGGGGGGGVRSNCESYGGVGLGVTVAPLYIFLMRTRGCAVWLLGLSGGVGMP